MGGPFVQHISNGFCHEMDESPPRLKILTVGAEKLAFFLEFCFLLHLPINFSHIIDARLVEHDMHDSQMNGDYGNIFFKNFSSLIFEKFKFWCFYPKMEILHGN